MAHRTALVTSTVNGLSTRPAMPALAAAKHTTNPLNFHPRPHNVLSTRYLSSATSLASSSSSSSLSSLPLSTCSRPNGTSLRFPPINSLITTPMNPPISSVTRQVRHSSHSPLGAPAPDRKKVTINSLHAMYRRGEPITVMTAHDFPSALVADHAGMDMILVGDSLAMVALGMEDTSEVLLEEMILHMRSVARATKLSGGAFTVGDMPMGTYEVSPSQALETAIRIIKEGRMQSVKLEGGLDMAPTIQRITSAGIPVLAHVGLTPQRQNSLGGFRVQGKTTVSALSVLRDALAVQEAGAFAVVLEAVPAPVAALISSKLRIPTIGIGAGNGTSGQVLVQVDMTGNFPPGRFLPKFVKQYGNVWAESIRAIGAYRDDVKSRAYPAPEHTYPMPQHELAEFERILSEADADADAEAGAGAAASTNPPILPGSHLTAGSTTTSASAAVA